MSIGKRLVPTQNYHILEPSKTKVSKNHTQNWYHIQIWANLTEFLYEKLSFKNWLPYFKTKKILIFLEIHIDFQIANILTLYKNTRCEKINNALEFIPCVFFQCKIIFIISLTRNSKRDLFPKNMKKNRQRCCGDRRC